MNTAWKLCKDCRYFGPRDEKLKTIVNYVCLHDKAKYGDCVDNDSLVVGPVVEISQQHYNCENMRVGICGPDAKHFAPRLEVA